MTANRESIQGMLFDMDGTLVDHLDTLARCFQYASQQLGVTPPTYGEVLRAIGGSMPVTIQKFLPAEKVEEGKRLWTKRFEEIHLEGVVVLPGAQELLDCCRSRSIKTGVFTNKTGRHTRAILANQGLDQSFDFILGAEDSPYRKPQPEFSRIALKKLGLDPESAALVGDSPFDIQAARSVGMTSLCVSTGSHSAAELTAEGADLVFESLHQIAAWLQGER